MKTLVGWASPTILFRRSRYCLSSPAVCCCRWWAVPTLLLLLIVAGHSLAQETTRPAPADLLKQSLPLRTALYHDATLAAPLERLLALYRSAGRVNDLIEIYDTHCKQYPNDQNALTVLVRLKAATGDPESPRAARDAVQRFPQNAFLNHMLYEILHQRHDPEALQFLDRAIQLQTLPNRRIAWVDQLLSAAVLADRRDLAEKHLKTLAADVATAEARLELAQKMNRFEFYHLALAELEKPSPGAVGPETMVATQLEAATAEVGLGRAEAAGTRLDKLLEKLTADYWQRGEIIRRRLALVNSQAEREAMIAAARKAVQRSPRDEAAALDLAQILAALQFRRDALDVLLEAGRRLPKSESIEKRTLEMFDRLRDERGRAEFLTARIKLQPQRQDLALQRIKTLYELGRRDEAQSELDGMVEQIAGEDRVTLLIEMARFLRRSTLLNDAAGLFRRLLDLAPERLEIRRELAETYAALGQTHNIRPLFGDGLPASASLEEVLDLVQFMIQRELFVEARRAVQQRLAQESTSLELQLLLLSIERRLGNLRAGDELIENTRKLADTSARYRLWLEAAVEFHDQFETVAQFLEAEQLRLPSDPPQWTTRRLERRLALAQVCADNDRLDDALQLLNADLAEDLPADFQVKIRRTMIALLEKQPSRVAELQEQLSLLAEQDRRFVDEANARLALLHSRAERHDLAAPLIEQINLANIRDASLLGALEPLYLQHRRPDDVLTILGRLTELNPTDRQNWQQWLMALASTGDESRLRGALRQLLSGVHNLPLDDETKSLLEAHLADSYWRSVARRLAKQTDAALADALVPLDAVERMAQNDEQWLWVAWVRAFALNRLGRSAARDEAIAELERVVQLNCQSDDGQTDEPIRIAFPDGLTIDLEHARQLLTQPAVPPPADPPAAAQGPLPPLEVAWTFDLNAAVRSISPLADDRLLIASNTCDLYCVDARGGKLLWSLPDAIDAIPMAHIERYGYSDGVPSPGISTPLTDGNGRIYVASVCEITCYSGLDGQLLWKADVGPAAAAAAVNIGGTHVSMFLYDEQLVTFEPGSGTITRVDPATGKVVWDMTVAAQSAGQVGWHTSGASLSGDWLMVYGRRSAIVDLKSGRVLWSFDPWRVRTFPVELREPADPADPASEKAIPPAPPIAAAMTNPYGGRLSTAQAAIIQQLQARGQIQRLPPNPAYPSRSYPSPYVQQPPVNFVDYLAPLNQVMAPSGNRQFQMGLTSPAVVWASLVRQGQPRSAQLIGGRALLLQGGNGMRIIHTDLPLSSRHLSVYGGHFLGSAGTVACFSHGQALAMIDVNNGTERWYRHQNAAGGNQMSQTALSGPLAYICSAHGIVECVNVLTGDRVFRVELSDDGSAGFDQQARLQSNSTVVYAPNDPFGGSSIPQRQQQVLNGKILSTTISLVDEGTLYTLAAPQRVVALRGAAADGR